MKQTPNIRAHTGRLNLKSLTNDAPASARGFASGAASRTPTGSTERATHSADHRKNAPAEMQGQATEASWLNLNACRTAAPSLFLIWSSGGVDGCPVLPSSAQLSSAAG